MGFSSLCAQESILKPIKKDSAHKNEWKFLITLDGRTTAVINTRSTFRGIRVGTMLNRRHKMGIGLYFQGSPVEREGVQLDPVKYPEATDTSLYRFGYSSLFYEPVWLRSRRWELSSPIHFGAGTLEASYRSVEGKDVNYFRGGAPLLEFSGVGQFKVFRWFAVGGGFGYRTILLKDQRAKRSLSAPLYIFQAKVLLGILYKLAFKKPIDDGWEKTD